MASTFWKSIYWHHIRPLLEHPVFMISLIPCGLNDFVDYMGWGAIPVIGDILDVLTTLFLFLAESHEQKTLSLSLKKSISLFSLTELIPGVDFIPVHLVTWGIIMLKFDVTDVIKWSGRKFKSGKKKLENEKQGLNKKKRSMSRDKSESDQNNGSRDNDGRRRENPEVDKAGEGGATDSSIFWIIIYIILPTPVSMELLGLIAAYGGPFAPLAKKLPAIGELRLSNLSGLQKMILFAFIIEDFIEVAAAVFTLGGSWIAGGLIPLDLEYLVLLAKIERKLVQTSKGAKLGKFAKWTERLTGNRIHHEMTDGGSGRNPPSPHGRAMTDGGQPRSRRNPPQGGNGLRGYSDIEYDDSGGWSDKLKKIAPIAAVILLIAVLGFVGLQVAGGGAAVGLGFLSGIIGFLTNPLLIGLLIFLGLAAVIFKTSGSSAGGKFLVGVPIALLLFGAIISFAIGGNPLNYLGYGDQVADSYAGALFGEAEGVARVYGQAKARVFCLLRGPACLRQWKLNNTQRPGSEDVGENYGLKIDSFQVGQGDQLDIAYKDKENAVPVSFTISNPRHGLKGIDARDVSYRIRIIDSDRGRSNPYCDTGWMNVQNAYDIDGQGGENDIYPGTSASTGFLTIDQDHLTNAGAVPAVEDREPEPITLESCEMLQPALGQNRVALLNLKYDYFSQATLDFQAMSRDYFQSNENIEKSIKESKTADTPVKAAINVNSPVLFTEDETGTRDPRPFAAKATLNTDKNDIQYKVQDFSILNSDYLSKLDGGNCQFTNANNPGEKMGLIQDSKDNIIAGEDDARDQSYYWFDTESEPPIFGCVMKLDRDGVDGSGINEISPSGETLTMRIKTNYTVSKRKRLGSLKVYNSICSRVDCPLIVTVQDNRTEGSFYNFKTTCSGLDAGNGCSIVKASAAKEGWSEVEGEKGVLNRDPSGDAVGADTNIESGEMAVGITPESDKNVSGSKYYGGLRKNKFEQIASSINDGRLRSTPENPYEGEAIGIVHYTTEEGEKELEIVNLRRKEDGTCEYTSYHLNSVLIWDNCEFKKGESGGGDSTGFWDVVRSIPIV